jgi:hypothetical protein
MKFDVISQSDGVRDLCHGHRQDFTSAKRPTSDVIIETGGKQLQRDNFYCRGK